jgi:hypothetical protein
MRSDMIEPLIPRLIPRLLQTDNRPAKPAPELSLAILPNPASPDLMLDGMAITEFVHILEVRFEVLRAREQLAAGSRRGRKYDLAAVGLGLEVLAVFVTLPV